MNKNFFFPVVLAIMLVFGIVGCDNGTTSGTTGGGQTDTWSSVTSLNQIDGTWKGTFSFNNKLLKDYMQETGYTWDSSYQAAYGDMRLTLRRDITLIFNSRVRTMTMFMVQTATYSGGNIDTMWPYMRKSAEENEDYTMVTFNNDNHSITAMSDYPAETLSDSDIKEMLSEGLQINQNDTKLKMPLPPYGTIVFSKQ